VAGNGRDGVRDDLENNSDSNLEDYLGDAGGEFREQGLMDCGGGS
jgi:hypothetical protein